MIKAVFGFLLMILGMIMTFRAFSPEAFMGILSLYVSLMAYVDMKVKS